MNNIIGLSLGSAHFKGRFIASEIEIIRKTQTQALEITFFTDDEAQQRISQDSRNYIKSLKYASIHAPMFYRGTFIPYFTFDIKRLREWYFDTNSQAILFHPNQKIPRAEEDMLFCVENISPLRFKPIDITKLLAEAKLAEYPELRLVLDTSHALNYDGYLEELIEKYCDRIQHVHLSDRRYDTERKKIRDHQTFFDCPDKEKFLPLKQLNCPILIEVYLNIDNNQKCIEILKREVESVREFFS